MELKPTWKAVAAVICLVLLVAAVHAEGIVRGEAGRRSIEAADFSAFLDRIQGAWQGQAVTTPIGPRPYDISFAPTRAGEVEGTAEPGGAIHTWSFRRDGDELKLRFLSSFRGNRRPLLLTARGESDGEMIFHALRPAFLSVRIRAEAQTLVLRVFHGERLHVEIRLRRR